MTRRLRRSERLIDVSNGRAPHVGRVSLVGLPRLPGEVLREGWGFAREPGVPLARAKPPSFARGMICRDLESLSNHDSLVCKRGVGFVLKLFVQKLVGVHRGLPPCAQATLWPVLGCWSHSAVQNPSLLRARCCDKVCNLRAIMIFSNAKGGWV